MAYHDSTAGISDAELEDHLAAIMAGRQFRNASKMRRLLAYLVDAVRNGNAAKLKGYTIGIEVLDRPDDFDPQIDPIVRVQARRLREALDQFYADEGSNLPLRIVIEKGSYRPVILRRPEAGEPARGAPEHATHISFGLPTRRNWFSGLAAWFARGWALPTIGIAVVSATALLYGMSISGMSIAVSVSNPHADPRSTENPQLAAATHLTSLGAVGPSASNPFAVRPIVRVVINNLNGRSVEDARFVAGILAQYNLFDLQTVLPGEHPIPPVAGGIAHFELRFDLCERCSELDGGLLLVAMPANTILHSARFRVREGDLRSAALPAIRVLGSLDGPVLAHIRRHRDHFPPFVGCLGNAYEFAMTFNRDSRARLRACVNAYRASGFVDSNMEQLVAFDAIVAYWHLEDVNENTQLALRSSRRAVELDPGNARSHLVRALVLSATGDAEQALLAARRGYSLNPFDDIMAFGFANALLSVGEVAEAQSLLAKARRENSHTPDWILVNLALTYLLSGDADAFTRMIPEMWGTTTPLGRILLLIAEARGGDPARVQSAFHQLKSAFPLLARPIVARLYLETHIRNTTLVTRVVAELEAAIAAYNATQPHSN